MHAAAAPFGPYTAIFSTDLKLCEFGRGANNCQRCSGRVPSLAAAAGKLAIIAGDEISTSNAPAELCFSPTLWAHQSMGRPGRRTFRFLPRIHSGWAISPPQGLSSHAA